MSDTLVGGIAKSVGIGAAGVVAVGLYFGTLGPHGFFKKIPECPSDVKCVAVAGLDDDVFWIPVPGGEGDWQDDDSERAVGWVRTAAARSNVPVVVIKYPREISMPEAGGADEARQRDDAVRQISAIGKRTGASLVVVGAVEGDGRRLRLSFVDPARSQDFDGDPPGYDASQPDAPAAFVAAAARALRGTGQPPLPTPRPPAPPPSPPREVVAAPQAPTPAVVAPAQPRATPAPAPPQPRPAQPVVLPPSPPPVVVRTPADISVDNRAKRAILRLSERRQSEFRAAGRIIVSCAVSSGGDLYDCRTTGVPAGAGSFARDVAEYADKEMRGTPATLDRAPLSGERATFPVVVQF